MDSCPILVLPAPMKNELTLPDFISKWEPVLTAWNTDAEDPQFADDCRALGFEMDCGRSFAEAFPGQQGFEAESLKAVLPQITDARFLGTAIFSCWRYFSHWECAPPPEDASEWFRLAFGRLRELTEKQLCDEQP